MPETRVCYVGGCGRLGYPMAVWTASKGYQTAIADINKAAVREIFDGTFRSPEPRVDELAVMAHAEGRLHPTTDVAKAAARSDLIFVITQTPSVEDGSFTEEYVVKACKEIGKGLRQEVAQRTRIVCIASTVMPGRTDGIIRKTLEDASGLTAHVDFGLCVTPEFVRQGAIVEDFSNPDFVVIGCEKDEEWEAVRAYYEGITTSGDTPIWRCSIPSAEIAKMGLNVAVTSKVARANELALLCHYTHGADADDVLAIIGSDSRIGSKYFSAGPPPGGPCFPRDNSALAVAMRSRGIEPHVTEGVNAHERYLLKRLAWIVNGLLDPAGEKTIGILGLTYKPGVNLTVGSPGGDLARELVKFLPVPTVYGYDPGLDVVMHCETPQGRALTGVGSLEELVERSDVLVLMTPWPEFVSLYDVNLMDKDVVDMWGFLPRVECKQYVRFGRG